MDTMLTYNTNSKTGPVCGGRAPNFQNKNHFPAVGMKKKLQRSILLTSDYKIESNSLS